MLSQQRGITLIESLVAIVVMALGVLGVLGVQMRTLADTQTGVRRAQAIRLIEDLSERIRVNPRGMSQLNSYTSAWQAKIDLSGDCTKSACTSAKLASYDKNLWLSAVRQNLPLGDAAIFLAADETNAANRRQLGVMISWRENEKVSANDSAAEQTAYKALFQPSDTGKAAISCPANRSCHLQYIQSSARCLPYSSGDPSAALVICPG
jgi:type IV pilus assembly protein PilV